MDKNKPKPIRTGDRPIGSFPGIGVQRQKAMEKLGADSAFGLLRCFPRQYQDRGHTILLSQGTPGEEGSFTLTVTSVPKTMRGGRSMTRTFFAASDGESVCEILFFGQPYLETAFRVGAVYRFYGKLLRGKRGLLLIAPQFEDASHPEALLPLFPVYPLSAGLTQKIMRDSVSYALSHVTPPETLPKRIRDAHSLPDAADAYRMLHQPRDYEELERARAYFIREDLYLFAIGMAVGRRWSETGGAPRMQDTDLAPFFRALPYELTGAQKRSIGEAADDMARGGSPMTRLVSGDVGSGKTMVAAAAAYLCMKNGYQCALMAPTEILASQHAEGLEPLFASLGYKTALLTGSLTAKQKREVKASLQNGETDLVIGTHALITPDVSLPRLGLVITDEQHRFGVAQRLRLGKTGENAVPHTMIMSATPIPRTLAMILYGDLSVSVVDEMPPGRQKVDTFVVDESYRKRLDDFIVKNVKEGGQVYVVCPAVEEKEEEWESELPEVAKAGTLGMKNAVGFAGELSARLGSDVRVGLVHGRMKPSEKDGVMKRFASGEVDVLVSTTVIEVGVNVPNASLMIVENAERFGLSQLHQLRGRVGRGQRKSFCVLVSQAKGETARSRLQVMQKESDGYRIAQYDLEQRGPGDFLVQPEGGTRQHGAFRAGMMSLCGDVRELKEAVAEAEETLRQDPLLINEENRPAGERVSELFGNPTEIDGETPNEDL